MRLSITQAVEFIREKTGQRIANSTLQRWIAAKKIRASRLGNRWFIEQAELERFLGIRDDERNVT